MRTKMEAANWWIQMAREDREVITMLLKGKKFSQVLFFCHLYLEKLLKAAYIFHKNDAPPYVHNLEKIATRMGVELTKEQVKDLEYISQFNISGRYPEEKMRLYEEANRELAEKTVKLTDQYAKWIKEEFLKT